MLYNIEVKRVLWVLIYAKDSNGLKQREKSAFSHFDHQYVVVFRTVSAG